MSKTARPAPLPEAPQIVLRPLDSLVAYARNARSHSPAQIEQLKASIVEFGWTNPVLADENGIVAGHGRTTAARALYDAGFTLKFPNGSPIPDGMVPVVDCTGWSEAQRRAYILADNKLALNAGWDMEMLKVELGDLKEMGLDLDLTGFDVGEIGAMLEPEGAAGDATPPEDFPSYDEEIETAFCCPSCGYRWSGQANSKGRGPGAEDDSDDDQPPGDE